MGKAIWTAAYSAAAAAVMEVWGKLHISPKYYQPATLCLVETAVGNEREINSFSVEGGERGKWLWGLEGWLRD